MRATSPRLPSDVDPVVLRVGSVEEQTAVATGMSASLVAVAEAAAVSASAVDHLRRSADFVADKAVQLDALFSHRRFEVTVGWGCSRSSTARQRERDRCRHAGAVGSGGIRRGITTKGADNAHAVPTCRGCARNVEAFRSTGRRNIAHGFPWKRVKFG